MRLFWSLPPIRKESLEEQVSPFKESDCNLFGPLKESDRHLFSSFFGHPQQNLETTLFQQWQVTSFVGLLGHFTQTIPKKRKTHWNKSPANTQRSPAVSTISVSGDEIWKSSTSKVLSGHLVCLVRDTLVTKPTKRNPPALTLEQSAYFALSNLVIVTARYRKRSDR